VVLYRARQKNPVSLQGKGEGGGCHDTERTTQEVNGWKKKEKPAPTKKTRFIVDTHLGDQKKAR